MAVWFMENETKPKTSNMGWEAVSSNAPAAQWEAEVKLPFLSESQILHLQNVGSDCPVPSRFRGHGLLFTQDLNGTCLPHHHLIMMYTFEYSSIFKSHIPARPCQGRTIFWYSRWWVLGVHTYHLVPGNILVSFQWLGMIHLHYSC